jgi:hypothetical protein
MRTWLSTEPSEYFVSSRGAAGLDRLGDRDPEAPGESGCSPRIVRPAFVSSDGLATTRAPNVSMRARRYGFWSYETLTMYTSTSSPKTAPANASAEPHCPAPVSVVSRVTPSALL